MPTTKKKALTLHCETLLNLTDDDEKRLKGLFVLTKKGVLLSATCQQGPSCAGHPCHAHVVIARDRLTKMHLCDLVDVND